ncbi:ionotropic receptor 75a-like [Tribolium madens]|uniref:ionotropic receptor 75a-like n=1 Tax=Tribolium madens TaxID=41895 RepID=UPI001CF72B4E|nr:ionotropic receptor 75a-like [Tribolium madens]
MLVFKTLLLLICLLIKTQANYINNLIVKTFDFIEILNVPVKISAHICWTRANTSYFMKSISDKYSTNLIKTVSRQYVTPEHQLFIVDLECNDSVSLLQEAEKLKLFKSPFKWLLFGNPENLPNLYFGTDSHIFVTEPKSQLNDIKTIYKNSPTVPQFVQHSFNQFYTSTKRRNLMGTTIKISYVITNLDSLNHLWDYRNSHIDAISKLNYIIVHNLMDYLNASRHFAMQPTWGYKNSTTGFYSGMVGDLQRGLADLGGTPLFFTQDRIDIIDYVVSTTPTYIKFIFRAPPLSYVTNVFTLPFDTAVWHYCFVMVAIVVVCIYIIVVWEWKETKFEEKNTPSHVDTLRPNIFDVVMFEIGAITQQGSNAEPKSNSGRIITIFSFLTLMFLYTSYSANIVALLQSTSDSIRNLEDLLNSRIKLGVEDIVYAHYYFENAQEPVKKAIYQQKVAPKGQKPNFMTAEEGIRKVQEGFFAFHVELSTGYKIISEMFQEGEKCGLKEIGYVNLIEPSLAMQKKSPYKEVMKVGIRKMHETGIQNRELRKIYTQKPQCHSRGSNFGSVGLIDCYSAFLTFGVGIALALLLFVMELILRRYFIRRENLKNTISIIN